jgi:hypothetical protein
LTPGNPRLLGVDRLRILLQDGGRLRILLLGVAQTLSLDGLRHSGLHLSDQIFL